MGNNQFIPTFVTELKKDDFIIKPSLELKNKNNGCVFVLFGESNYDSTHLIMIWEQISSETTTTLKFIKLEPTDAICKALNVNLPAIFLFKNGILIKQYTDEQKIENILDFILENECK